ncbi:MAG: peptidoglycan-binding protein [Blastocatellia bacterium]|jgi:hypothetical protein|nr:peptidoglycan-binding protein [Blastocatellia bacterium]
MLSRVLSLCAALILAIGMAGLPAAAKSKKSSTPKKTTAKKDTKKKSSKKNSREASAKKAKKSSKADSRSAKSRSRKVTKKDDRSAKRVTTPKRGKNEDEEKYAPNRSSQRDSRVAASSPVVQPTAVIAGGGATFIEGEDPDAPPAPRPANRIVSDIAPARVIQIQNALISQGLMTGPANGVYDQATFNAMSSFQSRKGYKPLGVPTADSLKALGVPKNSGRNYMSASRVLESTAPKVED